MLKLSERAGDSVVRAEAERIIEALAERAYQATFYAGMSRLHLPEERVILVMYKMDENVVAQASKQSGNYVIELNFPKLTEMILGSAMEIAGLSRRKVRNLLRIFLRNVTFRSYLVHELVHVMMRKRDVEYKADVSNPGDYANNPEELSAWFNQAVYDLTYKARHSKTDPKKVVGSDAVEFIQNVAELLHDYGMWDNYSDDTKKRVMKRATTSYQHVLRDLGISA